MFLCNSRWAQDHFLTDKAHEVRKVILSWDLKNTQTYYLYCVYIIIYCPTCVFSVDMGRLNESCLYFTSFSKSLRHSACSDVAWRSARSSLSNNFRFIHRQGTIFWEWFSQTICHITLKYFENICFLVPFQDTVQMQYTYAIWPYIVEYVQIWAQHRASQTWLWMLYHP